jgi:hypothetical protein
MVSGIGRLAMAAPKAALFPSMNNATQTAPAEGDGRNCKLYAPFFSTGKTVWAERIPG